MADKRGTPGKKAGKVSDTAFKDPLSDLGPLGAAIDGTDPLSMIAAESNAGLGSQKNRATSFVCVLNSVYQWVLLITLANSLDPDQARQLSGLIRVKTV